MRQGNGGRVRTKIGLWDEISLIAGWEEQKQLIVKNSGQNQCKKYFQQTITTLFAMSLRIKQQERESGGSGGAKIGLWDEISHIVN